MAWLVWEEPAPVLPYGSVVCDITHVRTSLPSPQENGAIPEGGPRCLNIALIYIKYYTNVRFAEHQYYNLVEKQSE